MPQDWPWADTPRIVRIPQGRWAAVWSTSDSIDGSFGNDFDVLIAFSDDLIEWTSPIAVNRDADVDAETDWRPAIAVGGEGALLVSWLAQGNMDDSLGTDADLVFARSRDGTTWSTAVARPGARIDNGEDSNARVIVTSDGRVLLSWTLGNELAVAKSRVP